MVLAVSSTDIFLILIFNKSKLTCCTHSHPPFCPYHSVLSLALHHFQLSLIPHLFCLINNIPMKNWCAAFVQVKPKLPDSHWPQIDYCNDSLLCPHWSLNKMLHSHLDDFASLNKISYGFFAILFSFGLYNSPSLGPLPSLSTSFLICSIATFMLFDL